MMLHPSYTDLMEVVNSEVEPGEQPVVQSRYSIVMAASKRARQIIAEEAEAEKNVDKDNNSNSAAKYKSGGKKPLSTAVEELYHSKIRILSEDEAAALAQENAQAQEDTEYTVEEDTEYNVEENTEDVAEETTDDAE